MYHFARRMSVWIVLAMLVVSCAAPPQPSDTAQQPPQQVAAPRVPSVPNRVIAGIPATPPFLYNKINVGGVGGQGSALQDLVHVGLSAYDRGNVLHPRLAEGVPSLENGQWKLFPDGRMETTWKLRPNAVWHDGTPFTAEDLAFTIAVVQDRQLPMFGNVAFGNIESVDAADPHTVTVRWHRPYIEADALFSADLAAPLPRHLLETAFTESKGTFTDLPYWGPEFVGTGPFKIREFERGSHLLVEAFDRYTLGRPKIDLVEVRFVSDETTLVANLLAGSIELTLARAISAEQGATLREQWRDGRVENSVDDWYIMYPQFLNPNPLTITDVRMRRGLLHATNRQQMADTLEGGMSSVIHAFVGPNEPEYKEVESSIVRYDYDPRRAAQLIESVGYTRGSDGFLHDASGRRLEIEINATRLDAHQKLVLTLKNDWEQVGVFVEPNIIPPQRAQDAEYRATFPGFAVQGHPREAIRFHSKEARLPERNYTGGNNARYMNPEMDALIDRYFVTIPRAERNHVLAQIVHHVSDQLVVLPLIWRVDPTAIGNRLLNVGPKGPDATQAWNAHEWDIKA